MNSQKTIVLKKQTLITLFTISFATLFSWTAVAQETNKQQGITITVTIENFLNDDGHALLALHTKNTFLKGQGLKNESSEIKDGKVNIVFTNVVPGTYAIMALHDANDNNRMDFEPNGMPKEQYGMSGNDMSFGPPQFVNAKFEVTTEDLQFEIRL